MRKLLVDLFLSLGLIGYQGGPSAPPPISVSVSPPAATVDAGKTQYTRRQWDLKGTIPRSGFAQSQDRQEMMKRARRAAKQGDELILNVAGGDVFVFYNNPNPFCYTYRIPGEWFASPEEEAWRSKDRRQFAGMLFMRSKALKGFQGATLVERAAASISRGYETQWKRSLTGVKLTAFESAVPGTWKWTADPVRQGDHEIRFPTKIIVDFSPDAVAELTIAGTADDDGLALRVLSTLRTTKESECYFPVLDAMFKATLAPSAESAAPTPSAAAPARLYTNPTYPWSVTYPADWSVDAADPSNVRVSSGDALCGSHSGPVRLKTADEFADLLEEQDEKAHFTVRHSPKQRISLPNGVVGVDVTREIRGGGRSRRIYVLREGVAYGVDCETHASKWEQFAPTFEQIIRSFTLDHTAAPPQQPPTK